MMMMMAANEKSKKKTNRDSSPPKKIFRHRVRVSVGFSFFDFAQDQIRRDCGLFLDIFI
jgi:hypothetical protein